jgi:nitronate monooxygenase
MTATSTLPPLRLRDRELVPIVQGGMGVGVSAGRLAGSVAREGAVGTVASVDLRRLHPDLMEQTGHCRDHDAVCAANFVALDREIRKAKAIAGGRGLIAVNVMRAVSHYEGLVRQACASGADAVVVGAGLPLDLPELTADFPDVALIPILSDVRGVSVVLKKWQRKGRLPDAIVIEHPFFAGGHLGSPKLEDLDDPRFDFEVVLPGVLALFDELGIPRGRIPLIPAGGVNSHEKVRALFALGASAVQVGTPFAVSAEGDAHPDFKRVLAEAGPEDIVTFMSDAGLPARAVRTPWLARYLEREAELQAKAGADRGCLLGWDCLVHCGLRDGNPKAGQFCIDARLALAVKGDVQRGLFFRGAEPLPFGAEVRPVRDLVAYLATGERPARSREPAALAAAP